MVPNDAVINVLRDHGFTFKKPTDRMMIWKKRGSTTRVLVRKNVMHDEEYVRILFKQAGLTPEEIESFFKSVNC